MSFSIKESKYELAYSNRLKLPVCVQVILKQKNKVLLVLRKSNVANNGLWSLPGGHIESGETFYNTAIRELHEELGIVVTEEDLQLKCIGHGVEQNYLGVFFICSVWQNEISNLEPNKCSKLEFFELNNIPENTIPYIKYMFNEISKGELYAPMESS